MGWPIGCWDGIRWHSKISKKNPNPVGKELFHPKVAMKTPPKKSKAAIFGDFDPFFGWPFLQRNLSLCGKFLSAQLGFAGCENFITT